MGERRRTSGVDCRRKFWGQDCHGEMLSANAVVASRPLTTSPPRQFHVRESTYQRHATLRSFLIARTHCCTDATIPPASQLRGCAGTGWDTSTHGHPTAPITLETTTSFSMSGAEAITLVQLISACIGLTQTVIDIGRATQDAKGLPPKLQELFERLPAINDILHSAHERAEKGEVSEESRKTIKPVLEQCRKSLAELQALFWKACPEDGDNFGKRLWKGTKTVFLGRDSKLQKHMSSIMENLNILEVKGILNIDGKLDDLVETVQVLAEEDVAVRNAHSGSGNLNVHEGPGNQYNVGGGSNNTFTNNFGTHVYQGRLEPDFAEQCLQSLAFPNMEVRGDINEKAEHTCEWIFELKDYRTWTKQGGLLWIKGRAGTGH
ncbi:hypothetical protein BST61_g7583 [Cercospora zeina]